MERGKTRNYCFHYNAPRKNIDLKKYYAENFIKTTDIETQSQHWGGKRQLSMKGISVDYFPI